MRPGIPHTWRSDVGKGERAISCPRCNHEALEAIERAARPYVVEMARGEGEGPLDFAAQRAVSAFALRVLSVAQFNFRGQDHVPSEHRAFLVEHGEPPTDVGVWLLRYQGRNLHSTMIRMPPPLRVAPSGAQLPESANGYHGVMRIGHLVMEIVAVTFQPAILLVPEDPSAHLRVWPPDAARSVVKWPPPVTIDEAAFQIRVHSTVRSPSLLLESAERSYRSEDAIAIYDEVIRRFGKRVELGARQTVAKALVNKAARYVALKLPLDAVAACEEVDHRFVAASDRVLREAVLRAWEIKSIALRELGRLEDALAACDQVAERAGDQPDPSFSEPTAKALLNKGIVLGRLGRVGDALAAYEAVVATFGPVDEPGLREAAAKALVNAGVAQERLEDPDAGLLSYEEVVRRYGDIQDEPGLVEPVAKALGNQIVLLHRLGRIEEATAVLAELSARPGGTDVLLAGRPPGGGSDPG
jgi:tetratricopeptide (TPR) repeat protein